MSSARHLNAAAKATAAAAAKFGPKPSSTEAMPIAAPISRRPVPAAKTRELPRSPALRRFLGLPEISRHDPYKKICSLVKLYQRQNPRNGRLINIDAKLKALHERRDKVDMLELEKIVSEFVKLK